MPRCESKVCPLNQVGRPLARIKAHCKICNGDGHPRDCTGKMIDGTVCHLHPFRLGRTPGPRRALSPERKAKMIAVLNKVRPKPCQDAREGLRDQRSLLPLKGRVGSRAVVD